MKIPRILRKAAVVSPAVLAASMAVFPERAFWPLLGIDALVEPVLGLAYDRLPEVAPSTGRPVQVSIEFARPLHDVDDRFLSVAIDTSQVLGGRWWAEQAAQVEIGRGKHRTDPFDFSRGSLRRMARALSPAYLRIGGTEADLAYYAFGDQGRSAPPVPYEIVLTPERWDEVNAFARAVGFDLFFTVNAGPGPRNETGAWSSEQLEPLLQYTKEKGYSVGVWELGNEVDSFWFTHGLRHRWSGEEYAASFRTFESSVRSYFPDALIAGPAVFYWPVMGQPLSSLTRFLPDFLSAVGDHVDVVTWHYYPTQSRRCPMATRRASADQLLDPSALGEITRWATEVRDLVLEHAPRAQSWLGETGSAQCGGQPGLSDRFASSLWWLDQLGTAARNGNPVVVRQTLSGSQYGLIDDRTLEPRPDYWASFLWKRLMGARVLSIRSTDDNSFVRAYAHCAPRGDREGATLLLINLDSRSNASIQLQDLRLDGALSYDLSADGLASREVAINGERMSRGDQEEELEGRSVEHDAGFVTLPPSTARFISMPAAGSDVCGEVARKP